MESLRQGIAISTELAEAVKIELNFKFFRIKDGLYCPIKLKN